jgi:hypothetical protein
MKKEKQQKHTKLCRVPTPSVTSFHFVVNGLWWKYMCLKAKIVFVFVF